MYKKAAEFWAELRVELLSASAFLSNEKPSSSQLWRLYWASHQVYDLLDHWCGLTFLAIEFHFSFLVFNLYPQSFCYLLLLHLVL